LQASTLRVVQPQSLSHTGNGTAGSGVAGSAGAWAVVADLHH
jgi:hypothetical protein